MDRLTRSGCASLWKCPHTHRQTDIRRDCCKICPPFCFFLKIGQNKIKTRLLIYSRLTPCSSSAIFLNLRTVVVELPTKTQYIIFFIAKIISTLVTWLFLLFLLKLWTARPCYLETRNFLLLTTKLIHSSKESKGHPHFVTFFFIKSLAGYQTWKRSKMKIAVMD